MADTTEDQSKGGADGADHATVAPTSASASNDNKFQQAVAAWRSLDLTTLVKALDTTAEEMVGQQKESLVQRKELAAKTKDFRKMDDTAKLAEMKDLLKAYQSYIDVVTTHNKTVSSAFMQAYSPLSEAPDPYPLLEASIDSLITADEVVPKLEGENEQLHKQVSKLNGQLEDTEKQLEAERNKRQSFEGSQDSRVKEVEDSWTKVLQEKEENWTSKEKSLEEKVENQERLLKELKASYEVSQRLEKSGEEQDVGGRNSAAAAELEIVTSELEKTSMRLSDMEGRNEQLRLELAQTATQSHSSGRNSSVEDDPAFLRLRSENSSLLRRLDTSRFDRDADKSTLENRLRGMERELTTLKADRDALQSKVSKWSDYDEVKRELEMIRAIEFSGGDDLDENEDTSHATSGTSQGGESLEQLLVVRNKKISNELTELRVSNQELQRRFEDLQEDLSTTNMELEKSRNLNATLENDLQKTQQEASNAFETMSVAGTYTSRYPKSAYGSRRGGGGTSPTSSIIGGFEGAGSSSPRTLDSLRAGEAGVGGGILPMVTAQRDRFKKKMGELETELQKQYALVSSLRSEIASLQKDNLNLYEKTRYVSSYNRVQPTTSGAAYGGNPNPSTVHIGDGRDLDGKYKSAYEQNLSPFAAFRGRESARVLKRMSLPEKAVWRVMKLVLATRWSRNLFAIYLCGLHVLVLMTMVGNGDAVAGPSMQGATAGVLGGGPQGGAEYLPEGFESGGKS